MLLQRGQVSLSIKLHQNEIKPSYVEDYWWNNTLAETGIGVLLDKSRRSFVGLSILNNVPCYCKRDLFELNQMLLMSAIVYCTCLHFEYIMLDVTEWTHILNLDVFCEFISLKYFNTHKCNVEENPFHW